MQSYDTDVGRENVLLNNDVLFQCNIPSFISDFVSVLAWVDSEGSSFSAGQNKFGNPLVQKLDPLFLGLRSLRRTIGQLFA